MIRITIPIPPRSLSPNARSHWATRSAATRATRHGAAMRAMAAMRASGVEPPRWERAETRTRIYWPDKRIRDRDNAQGRLKPVWDGLADAGVVQNDAGFTHHAPEMLLDRKDPRIEIEVEKSDGKSEGT